MNARVVSLVFAPFAFGTSGFGFVGLIEPMAESLSVSVPLLGQLQAFFALACCIGGPLFARLLAHIDRKRLLAAVMFVLFAMNAASAMAPDFTALAVIRMVGGLFAALTLPLASTLAVNLVSETDRPAAIATVLGGYTLAFLIGMPICTLLGNAFGWPAACWFAAVLSLAALAVTLLAVPGNITAPQIVGAGFRVALRGDNPRLLGVTLLGFTATFITVSFMGPVITAFSGVQGASIGGVQIATGVGSLLGLPAGAMLARAPIKTALAGLFILICLTQILYSIGMLLDLQGMKMPLLVLAMSIGSAALFALNPVVQTQLAKTAGPAATIAFALNSSMVFLGQGLGATLGGLVTSTFSISWIGVSGAVAALCGLGLAVLLRNDAAQGN